MGMYMYEAGSDVLEAGISDIHSTIIEFNCVHVLCIDILFAVILNSSLYFCSMQDAFIILRGISGIFDSGSCTSCKILGS